MNQQLQFIKPLFLKETLQLLLALSIFLFSYSLWIFYFPRMLSQLSDYSIDRSYMFLLCNGILVFLGLVGASSFQLAATDFHGKYLNSSGVYPDNYVLESEVYQVPSLGYVEYATKQDEEEEEEEVGNEYIMKNVVEQVGFRIKGEEEEECAINNGPREEQNGYWITEQVQDEEDINEAFNPYADDVETGHGLLTTEELNKLFDEFIRKTKENLGLGTQTQLIMV